MQKLKGADTSQLPQKQEEERQKKMWYTVPPPTPEEYILHGLQLMKDEMNSLLRKMQNEYIELLWSNVEEWIKAERRWLRLVSKLGKEYCACGKNAISQGLRTAIEELLRYSRRRRAYLSGRIWKEKG